MFSASFLCETAADKVQLASMKQADVTQQQVYRMQLDFTHICSCCNR